MTTHAITIPTIPLVVKAPIGLAIAGFAAAGWLDPFVDLMFIVWFGYEIAVNEIARKHCRIVMRLFVKEECDADAPVDKTNSD